MIREFAQRYFARNPMGAPSPFLTGLLGLAAAVWRRVLFRTTFIAITGSFGKTTAKECLAKILASQAPTASSWRNQNCGAGVWVTVLRVRPWHRFAVIEMGAGGPVTVADASRLVRPDIAVITKVGRAHTSTFSTLEDVANTKAGIAEGLKPGGVILLNGDDPLVKGLTDRMDRTVHFFGTDPSFRFRAEEISAEWPGRLQFKLHHETESVDVRTPYVGSHWVPSVLAALAAARTCGVGLSDAAQVLAQGTPFDARLEPVELPNGAIVLRDEYNASIDTIGPAFEVMRTANARRRVLILSDYSESTKRQRRRVNELGREAANVADEVIFVGESAVRGQKAAIEAGLSPEHAHAFEGLQDAAGFLKSFLQRGDLVLLKGRASHHLSRLFFAQLGHVDCWKPNCSKMMLCDICPELGPAARVKESAKVVAPAWADAPG